MVLLGPSGCGKSTLLHILAGLLEAKRGEVQLDGEPAWLARGRKQIAWMSQRASLLPWMSVAENIALAQRVNPQNERVNLSVEELLGMVDLREYKQAYPFMLSGGMQQRVALARTLALGAKLWLMDEPFASLDEITRETLQEKVLDLYSRFQTTVIWVTHSVYEALRLAQRVLVLSKRPAHIQAEFSLPSKLRDELFYAEYAKAVRHSLRLGLI